MSRPDGRTPSKLRPVKMLLDPLRHAEGSCEVSFGQTRVLCAATFTSGVPGWRRGAGAGWVTAEYNMLPRSGMERTPRTSQTGGRSREIQRLISRSLRAVVDLEALGENTIVVDCDVIEADGGTRTASITGAMVALVRACDRLVARGVLKARPVRELLAAVSVGLVEGEARLDLDYAEDSRADVDLNLVMTAGGQFIELQGTAEGMPFDKKDLNAMLSLGTRGIRQLVTKQERALERAGGAA